MIGNAVHVMRIATGELPDDSKVDDGKEYARKGGRIGGRKRAQVLSKKRRSEIAKKAALARWGHVRGK